MNYKAIRPPEMSTQPAIIEAPIVQPHFRTLCSSQCKAVLPNKQMPNNLSGFAVCKVAQLG